MAAMRVAVLGGGIIGTTSAFRLKKSFPQWEMTMIAAEFSPHTTSDVAAGYWEPHLDPDTDPALVSRWAAQTYRLLAHLARGHLLESLGSLGPEMMKTVRRLHGTTVDNQQMETPAWSEEVSQYRTLDTADIEVLVQPADKEIFGNSFLSFTWEASKALPLFYRWLEENGVRMVQRRLTSISEVEADLIINCTGLGSFSLLGDQRMFPVSGHVCRVKCCWVGDMMADNRPESWAYVIPNTETVVLGSVDTEGNWDTEPRPGDRERIMDRCDKLCPGIKVDEMQSRSLHNVPLMFCTSSILR